MSAVTVGTRLERLRTLERQVKVQIGLEEQRLARGGTAAMGVAYPVVLPTASAPVQPLPPASTIRAWAISEGYLPPHQRHGRVPIDVIDLYREQVLS